MLQHLLIQFSPYYLSSCRSREVKNFWLRSLRTGGHLQEVPNIVIRLDNFGYFGKVVPYERWPQPDARLYPSEP